MTRQTPETGGSAAKQDEAFRPFVNRRFPHLLHGADVFLMNFAGEMRRVSGPALAGFVDATDGTAFADGVDLASHDCRVLRRSRILARG